MFLTEFTWFQTSLILNSFIQLFMPKAQQRKVERNQLREQPMTLQLTSFWLGDGTGLRTVNTVLISCYHLNSGSIWGETPTGKKEDEAKCGVRLAVSEPGTNKKYLLLEYQAVFRTSESPVSTFEVTITIFTRWLLNPATLFDTKCQNSCASWQMLGQVSEHFQVVKRFLNSN